MTEIRTLKDFLSLIVKGICVGIAMFIPGVSGGTLALMLGIYEDIIESVAGIRKHFKASIIYLIPFLLGGIIGYALALLILGLGLKYIPIPTISLFAGLIIGGIPSIVKNVKGYKLKASNILCSIIAAMAVVGIAIVSIKFGFNIELSSMKPWNYLIVFLGGAITACALVVPGISGSAILLAIGLYNLVVLESVPGVLKFNENFRQFIIIDLLFILGAIVGLLVITKLMRFLLKNKKTPTFYAILGFVLGSIFAIYYNDTVLNDTKTTFNGQTYYKLLADNVYQYILVVVLLVAGIIAALYLEKLSNRIKINKSNKEIKEPIE